MAPTSTLRTKHAKTAKVAPTSIPAKRARANVPATSPTATMRAPTMRARADAAATSPTPAKQAKAGVERPFAIGKGTFQLATLVEHAPKGEGWVFERKLDGFRAMAAIRASGEVELWSRNALSFNTQFPSIVAALSQLSTLRGCIVDGEVVAYEHGTVSFHAMQQARDGSSSHALVYFVFDLLAEGASDLRALPLNERRERLRARLGSDGVVRRLDYDRDGERAMALARQSGDEGIIAKREHGPYRGDRSLDWQKIKITSEDDFVVVGYTASKKEASAIGSLVLATREHKASELRYAGRVGTGFSESLRRQLAKRLSELRVKIKPVDAPRDVTRGVIWTAPKLVARVRYFSYTPDGALRHPVFVGERDDIEAAAVAREIPVKTR
jgi:bifunctional non-homologous end joining protein LigD